MSYGVVAPRVVVLSPTPMGVEWFPDPLLLSGILSKIYRPILTSSGQNKTFTRLLFVARTNIYQKALKCLVSSHRVQCRRCYQFPFAVTAARLKYSKPICSVSKRSFSNYTNNVPFTSVPGNSLSRVHPVKCISNVTKIDKTSFLWSNPTLYGLCFQNCHRSDKYF